MAKVFPGRATPGETRNITPNGTVKSTGEQHSYSNRFFPKGNLGTTSTAKPLWPQRRPGNRTGEGCDGY